MIRDEVLGFRVFIGVEVFGFRAWGTEMAGTKCTTLEFGKVSSSSSLLLSSPKLSDTKGP